MMINTKNNESGFAAIMIAVTLIMVLSLLTVGFAELMRHEQRSALDKHLSNQAYYAAEAGISDAAQALSHGFTGTKTKCDNSDYKTAASGTPESYLSDNTVGDADNVYSCLLIDPAPLFLEYTIPQDSVKSSQISGFLADGTTPAYIYKLTISWDKKDDTSSTDYSLDPTHKFPTTWTSDTGIVRSTIMPLKADCLTRTCMIGKSFTSFNYPVASGQSQGPNSFNIPLDSNLMDGINGKIIDGNCDPNRTSTLPCTISITNIIPSYDYLFMMQSIYGTGSHIRVTANDVNGNPLRLRNAQTVVDSTGKAQDVLRRIQVRIPSTSSYDVPNGALDVMSGICKQLQLRPASTPANPQSPSSSGCTP